MLRQILGAMRFRRDAYLRAVLSANAVADGLIVVTLSWVVLGVAVAGSADLLLYARWIVNGLFSWIVLSGAIYLLGRYVLEGYGSFPGVMAVTALAHPALVLILLTRFAFTGFLAILAGTGWFFAVLVFGAVVALELKPERALLAAGAGYLLWLLFIGVL